MLFGKSFSSTSPWRFVIYGLFAKISTFKLWLAQALIFYIEFTTLENFLCCKPQIIGIVVYQLITLLCKYSSRIFLERGWPPDVFLSHERLVKYHMFVDHATINKNKNVSAQFPSTCVPNKIQQLTELQDTEPSNLYAKLSLWILNCRQYSSPHSDYVRLRLLPKTHCRCHCRNCLHHSLDRLIQDRNRELLCSPSFRVMQLLM